MKQLIVDRGHRWKRMPIAIVATFVWLGSGLAAFPDLDSLEVAITAFDRSLLLFSRSNLYRSELYRESSK